MAILSDMVGEFLEIFIDDFSVFGESFDGCLENLTKVLKRCIESNLVLSWKKSHFLVRKGIVLGHVISKRGIEVDKAKVELISNHLLLLLSNRFDLLLAMLNSIIDSSKTFPPLFILSQDC